MIDHRNAKIFRLSPANALKATDRILGFLIEGEEIEAVFQTVHDQVFYTTKRIIAFNIHDINGRIEKYSSVPYSRNRWMPV